MPQSSLGKDLAGKVPASNDSGGVSSTITSIVTVPGFDTTGQGSRMILVGIVIDNSSIAWGTCAAYPSEALPDSHVPLSTDAGVASIEAIVAPALVGQKLTTFRHLASVLESLRETVTISKPTPKPEGRYQGVSRRAIISGFLASEEADEAPAEVEETTIERTIHPVIRYGLSQALLEAVAMVRDVTSTEAIVDEFDLPVPSTAVPLQMPIKRGQKLQLHDQISTLAYAVPEMHPEESLGAGGERIQRFIRRLRESLTKADYGRQITLHLDVAGGLGRIFDQDLGKILGALYGLQQAAAPFLIRVQDPFIMDDLDAQIEALSQLRGYIRMRGMSLQLVASAGIKTADDVRAFAQAEAAHMLRLIMPGMGTIQELVVASQECRANDTGIMLEAIPTAISSQVALAIQPDVLTFPNVYPPEASIATLHNEMAKTLTWLAKKAT